MPHDKHGKLIEIGDVIKAQTYNEDGQLVARACVVTEVTPGSTSCNLRAVYPMVQKGYWTASEVELLTKKDGSPV